jgi:hypothetical protein
MNKPFHLMTRAEQTAARIAQNRAIAEKTGGSGSPKPPTNSDRDFTRVTPEDHTKIGGVIRKINP